MTHYPKEIINGNHRLTYEYKCSHCQTQETYKNHVGEYCAGCDRLAFPKLIKDEKINLNIPDPEPDPDIPF
jgi:hypothetical protein